MKVKVIRVKGETRFNKCVIDTKDVIEDMYAQGYTLKCSIPAITYGYGCVSAVDLVFEKEE